jgi:uncharacterized protein YjdB
MANITKLSDAVIKQIDKMCPGSQKSKLALVINDLIEAINLKHEYVGYALTDKNINDLNNLCPAMVSVELGTLLDAIITATGDTSAVDTISTEQKAILNGGFSCPTLSKNLIGDKINEMITKINNEDPVRVTSITIDSTKTVDIGNPEIMTITWNPSGSTNKEYTVTSSAPTKATVAKNEDGTFTVTGLAVGTSTITVTPTDGGAAKKKTSTITVVESVESISIPSTQNVTVGTPEVITITWTPTASTNKEYTVISSDESKATVTKNENGTFTITGITNGTADITVTPTDGGESLAEICAVTVIENVESISIPATKDVVIGTPEIITITWDPTTSTDKTYTVVSSDETKATVAINGNGTFTITGLVAGTTDITVTPVDGGAPLAEVCAVTVTTE